jgi:hypothetical protein
MKTIDLRDRETRILTCKNIDDTIIATFQTKQPIEINDVLHDFPFGNYQDKQFKVNKILENRPAKTSKEYQGKLDYFKCEIELWT